MVSEKSIVLIGFMGVGKTTIGQKLAEQLDWEFIDIDELIEKQYEMPTKEIFKTYGEKQFRETEMERIIQLAGEKGKVISVGGGAFLREETRKACLKMANVIHLDMSFQVWQNRIPKIMDSRPVLQGKKTAEIEDLFNERKPVYEHHHLQVNVDELSPEQAATAILKRLPLDTMD